MITKIFKFINKLTDLCIPLACACLSAIFGGYTFAALVGIILTNMADFLGIEFQFLDSALGSFILFLSLILFAVIGFAIGLGILKMLKFFEKLFEQ